MKVILTTLNSKYIHTSLALAYLEAACRCPDWELEVCEFTINENLEDIMTSIYQTRADVICFSTYIWNIEKILTICRDYKKVAPLCTIILGGPEVSYDAAQVLTANPDVDYVVVGEGEATLKELLEKLDRKEPVTDIKGISYRQNDRIQVNLPRPVIEDLDVLASPINKDLTDYKERVVYYETTRGCPFNCAYCLSSASKGVRYFPLERVKNELKHVLGYQLRELKLVDRTFNYNERRAREIMQFIIEQKSKTKVHLEICADILSESFMDFLSQVPPDIFNFEIGVQSTYLPTLRAVNRFSNWERLKKNILTIKSFRNIHLHLDLIAGLPLESYSRFQMSFNDVYHLQPHMLQLGFLKLLKGSLIYRKRKEHDYCFQSHPPYQILSNRYISYDEIIRLKQIEKVLNRYYNAGITPSTLDYVINSIYDGNAFKFFEELALYWERNELFSIGHRREKQYDILLEFLNYLYPDKREVFNELIKFDFLSRNLPHHFPEKVIRHQTDTNRELLYNCLENKVFKELPVLPRGSKRELLKYLHLEYFTINPFNLKSIHQLFPLLFIYDPTKKRALKILVVS
ncbi:MAG: DUF4080 domain-containing protein [Syntrophomonadaceae bacterium]|jgi:radical SAM superfamily enzyme YgiQ (UPF0313 family)